MKRILTLITAMFMALFLSACATSPRDAKIEDGKIENITSAEAVTLMKRQQRKEKVDMVMQKQKPIVRLIAHKGKPITIDAENFEVYVPLDIELLLAEEADAVSENIQMAREIRGGLRETAVPLTLGAMALTDRNNARASSAKQAEIEAEAAVKMETLRSAERQTMIEQATKDPIILTLPVGGSAGILGRD